MDVTVGFKQGEADTISLAISMDMDMTMNIDAGEGTSASLKMNCTADVALTINATGDSVKITYPDFSKFEEVDMTATQG